MSAMPPCTSLPQSWSNPSTFENHIRKTTAQIPGPCPLDMNHTNIKLAPQGSWSCVLADLKLVFEDQQHIKSIEDISLANGIMSAFNFRRELVNLKKVYQHIMEHTKEVEKQLKQLTTFFFNDIVKSDDPNNKVSTNRFSLPSALFT